MKFKLPAAHTILLLITIAVAIAAHFIPAGQYQKITYSASSGQFELKEGEKVIVLPATQQTLDSLQVRIALEKFVSGDLFKPIAIPNTYSSVVAEKPTVWQTIQAPIKGMIDAAEVIFFVLIIGGFIGVTNETKAIDKGLLLLTKILKGREFFLIIIITSLATAGGTTFGMAEELIAFIPLLVPVFAAMGYDAMLATSCLFLGSSLGTTIAITNPFSTIIASNAAGVNWTSGTFERIIALGMGWILTVGYLLWYGSRQKRLIPAVISTNQNFTNEKNEHGSSTFSINTLVILLVFAACFVIMIYGVAKLNWWFTEMTAVFLAGALVIALVARLREKKALSSFLAGCSDMVSVGLIIGIARGISVLMDDSQISDTLLYQAGNLLEGMSGGLYLTFMFFVFAFLSFFIPSTSGMAVLTMPIFAPMADAVGVERERLVNAYLYGQGWFNTFNPTSLILVYLSAAGLRYDRFMRFVWPLLIMLLCLLLLFLIFVN